MAYPPLKSRLERLRGLLEDEKADALVLASPANLTYFTGYMGPGVLVATRQDLVLLVPPLEYSRALAELESADVEVEVAVYKPYELPPNVVLADKPPSKVFEASIESAVSSLVARASKILYDDLPLSLYLKLAGKSELKSVGIRIAEWRSVKEAWELERIKVAIEVAEAALDQLLAELHEGMSELEGAGLVEQELRRRGAEDHAFPPIVAFGENTVYPHARPSSRRLRLGAPVLVDLGARYKGYCSDMTRTTFYGEVEREFKSIAEAVIEALEQAIDAIAPGVEAREVDAVAREVLKRRGLDKYFVHSLGHGLGLEVHEYPRLSPSSRAKLEPGMVVTVEPGVYIPGRFGVRVEEVILVTRRKGLRLTSYLTILW